MQTAKCKFLFDSFFLRPVPGTQYIFSMYFEENHAFICMFSQVIQNPFPWGATIRKTKAQHTQDRPAPFLAGHLLLLVHVTLGRKCQGSWVSWPLSPDPGQLQGWRLEAAPTSTHPGGLRKQGSQLQLGRAAAGGASLHASDTHMLPGTASFVGSPGWGGQAWAPRGGPGQVSAAMGSLSVQWHLPRRCHWNDAARCFWLVWLNYLFLI